MATGVGNAVHRATVKLQNTCHRATVAGFDRESGVDRTGASEGSEGPGSAGAVLIDPYIESKAVWNELPALGKRWATA
jgi:hypothetical protein